MKKYFYKLLISYDGQQYFGWQIQKETDQTIQGQLNLAFKEVTGLTNFKTIGSGRTDTGVHALGQVVLLEADEKLPEQVFFKGMNQRLPQDIQIINMEFCDSSFHPIFSAKSKIYQYVLSLEKLPPFLAFNFLTYLKPLDLNVLNDSINCFLGEHDFLNYFCVGTDVKSTVRTILQARADLVQSFDFGNYSVTGKFLKFEFEGTGFLKQQVRLMVGALLALNEGKISKADLKASLSGQKIKHLAPVAPAAGLYLKSVNY